MTTPTPTLLLAHLDAISAAPGGIARLRKLILQLAVQGRLVEQDPNDEPASVLLERIREEKARLVKARSNKRDQVLPKIEPSEIPFEMPSGWIWERLGNIGDTNIGLTYSPNEISETGIPVLRSNNIQNGRLDLSGIVRVSSQLKESVMVQTGDLLICARNGSRSLVGKVALIKNLNEPAAFGAFMTIYRSIINPYIYHFICSPLFRQVIDEVGTTTINQITQSNLRSTIIPLPPLAEQHRIVARVDALLALCDALEAQQHAQEAERQRLRTALVATLLNARDANAVSAAWSHLSASFDLVLAAPEDVAPLRQAVLQLAVQGRLVAQDPNDEPASVLLERIRATKSQLHNSEWFEGSEYKPPFTLPNGWSWTTVEAITIKLGAGSTPLGGKSVYQKEGVKFIRSQNVWNDGLRLDDVVYISEETHKKCLELTFFQEIFY